MTLIQPITKESKRPTQDGSHRQLDLIVGDIMIGCVCRCVCGCCVISIQRVGHSSQQALIQRADSYSCVIKVMKPHVKIPWEIFQQEVTISSVIHSKEAAILFFPPEHPVVWRYVWRPSFTTQLPGSFAWVSVLQWFDSVFLSHTE